MEQDYDFDVFLMMSHMQEDDEPHAGVMSLIRTPDIYAGFDKISF